MQVNFWLSQPINYWNFFSHKNLSKQTVFANRIESFFASLMSHQYPIIQIKEKPEICCLFILSFFFAALIDGYIGQQGNGDSINFCFFFCFCFHSRAKAIEWVWRVAWMHFHFEWRPGSFFVIISQANRVCFDPQMNPATATLRPNVPCTEVKQKLYLLAPVL